jgi:catechol 2,3-dioxygenase-like lactoylglutathione lyase family enzyme
MPNIVKRTTLIVRNLDRSLAFYRDVLGFSVWYDDEIVLSGVGLAAGAAGDRTRLGIGDVVFVMQTDDLAGLHRRLVDSGARMFAAPHEFRVRGADAEELHLTSLSCWDPDGYFYEINERRPA